MRAILGTFYVSTSPLRPHIRTCRDMSTQCKYSIAKHTISTTQHMQETRDILTKQLIQDGTQQQHALDNTSSLSHQLQRMQAHTRTLRQNSQALLKDMQRHNKRSCIKRAVNKRTRIAVDSAYTSIDQFKSTCDQTIAQLM